MKKNIKNNFLATILILHGSSDIKWNEYFIKNLNNIKNNIFFLNKISICYIEKIKPLLIQSITNFIKKNFKKFLLIPIFIGYGKHIKIDLPIITKNILKIYNKIKIYYSYNIGRDNYFIKLLKNLILKKIFFFKKNLKLNY